MERWNDIVESKKAAVSSEDTEKSINLELKTVESEKSLLTVSLRNIESECYPWLLSIKNNKKMRKALKIRMKILMTQAIQKANKNYMDCLYFQICVYKNIPEKINNSILEIV